LPYWKTQLLRHNIDVMHTKINVFNTVMDTKKARLNLAKICHWKELELKDIDRGKIIKPKTKDNICIHEIPMSLYL